MWWEIIPSFAVMTGALMVPAFASIVLNYLVLGNPNKRATTGKFNLAMFKRDQQLTGFAYKVQGLEAILDEVDTSQVEETA